MLRPLHHVKMAFFNDYTLVVDNEREQFENILGRENTRAGSVSVRSMLASQYASIVPTSRQYGASSGSRVLRDLIAAQLGVGGVVVLTSHQNVGLDRFPAQVAVAL